jgi:hypothetical protein
MFSRPRQPTGTTDNDSTPSVRSSVLVHTNTYDFGFNDAVTPLGSPWAAYRSPPATYTRHLVEYVARRRRARSPSSTLFPTHSHTKYGDVARECAELPCFRVGLTASTWTVFYVMMLDSMRTHSSTNNRFACTDRLPFLLPHSPRTRSKRRFYSPLSPRQFHSFHDFIVCYFLEGPNHNISPSSLLLRFACWLAVFLSPPHIRLSVRGYAKGSSPPPSFPSTCSHCGKAGCQFLPKGKDQGAHTELVFNPRRLISTDCD